MRFAAPVRELSRDRVAIGEHAEQMARLHDKAAALAQLRAQPRAANGAQPSAFTSTRTVTALNAMPLRTHIVGGDDEYGVLDRRA